MQPIYDTGNHPTNGDVTDYAGQEEAIIRALRRAQTKAAQTNNMMPSGRLSNPFDYLAQYLVDRDSDNELSAAEKRAAEFGKEKSRYITDLVTQMSQPGVVTQQTPGASGYDPSNPGAMNPTVTSRAMDPEETAQRNLPLAMKLMQVPGGEAFGTPAYAQALALPAARQKAIEERQARVDLQNQRAEDQRIAREENSANRIAQLREAAMLRPAPQGRQEPRDQIQVITDKDGKTYRMNLQTGEMMPVALPSATSPNPLVKTVPGAGGTDKPLTDAQSKNVLYGSKAAQGHKILNEFGNDYNVTALHAAQKVEDVPLIGETAYATLGPKEQQIMQAQRNFLNAVLRKESGAAINAGEYATGRKQYFPQPGESDIVVAQKAKARELAIQGISLGAGKAGKEFINEQNAETPKVAPTVVREVQLKDGRTGVEYSDGTRGYK